MEQMLAAFFALIFAFGHTSHATRSSVDTPVSESGYVTGPAPTRQEITLAARANRYAGSACLSCRRTGTMTTVSYHAR